MSTEISSYEQQAIDFLTASNTTLTSDFEAFEKHFDDDKMPRNVFKVTIKNAKHKYCFRFGSSLKDSLKNSDDVILDDSFDFYSGLKYGGLKREYLSYSAKMKIQDLKAAKTFNECKKLIDKKKAQSIYTEFLQANTTKYSKPNIISFDDWFEVIVRRLTNRTTEFESKNWGEPIKADTIIYPTAYDVLACLQKYDCGTFENFCSEFGYDSDSRKAYKTYKAVKKEWENIKLLFTPEQLELLQEIN